MNDDLMCTQLTSDHAVLQRNMPLPLCGAAAPGERVTIEFRGRQHRAAADTAGKWRIVLDPQESGGPDDLVISTAAGRSVTVRDVLVGEVWVCAGQSNMAFALKDATGGLAEAAQAQLPLLRLLTVPHVVADQPCNKLPPTGWQACAPEAAASFSAVGYYFGKHLVEKLDLPVGLIQAAIGATPAESWVARTALESDGDYRPILERWRRSLACYPDPEQTYAKAFAEWDRAADTAEREGRPIPGAHPKLIGPGHSWTPSGLFNGMIAPLTAFPIRGVIWYQGAAAPERAHQYRKVFRALIRDWRRAWGQGDFPFLFVQEAAFGPKRAEPCEHSWAELREAQQMALAEPNTAMAVAVDVGAEKDIHPPDKKPVGDRLALLARSTVYHQHIPCTSPVVRAMTIDGPRVRLRFSHTYGRLLTSDSGPLKGFAISGGATDFSRGNRGFVWAEAQIEGNDIVIWSHEVARPQAVRYAWAQNPTCNLINAAGIPAAPFRTDDWPGVTVSNL